MAVGATPLTFYQGENISPRFTVTDARVTDVTGWTTTFVIKAGAEDADPPLHTAAGVVFGAPPTLIIDVPTLLPLTLDPQETERTWALLSARAGRSRRTRS